MRSVKSANIVLRKAREDDLGEIWLVHTSSIREICRGHYTPAQIASWVACMSPKSYRKALKHKVLLVAEGEDGSILGFGQINPAASIIERLYVSKSSVMQGVGSALLAALEKFALSRGIFEVRLQSTLNARGFYERCGWKTVEKARCLFPGGLTLDCIRMKKKLR